MKEVSSGGKTVTNLRFADDIDDVNGLPGNKDKLARLVDYLDKTSTAYGI